MKKILLSVGLFALVLFSQNVMAQMKYLQGRDYEVLKDPLPLQKSGHKEVLEFFSYACPHCADLNPEVVKWEKERKPEDVDFYQMPALGGSWTFVGRVKFTADKLGLNEEFDKTYFDLIHKERQRKYMGDEDAAFALLSEKAKVSIDDVKKAWNSLSVKNQMQKSNKLWQQSGITGVPTIIVNGKYVVRMSEGGTERLFDVIEFLLITDKL
ncbi:MAG: thiol:disulfide interchange protein DsbA/DsbL [Gammaproteobacteria bacterium]|nr:thiol:disulfide interchange protein DsbA/DsbL [Gammaproteobacteria bacterium]